MSNRPRWLAAVTLLGGVAIAVAVLRSLPADAGRASPLDSMTACAARPATGPGGKALVGAFYALEPRLDADGTLIGQRLFVGRGGVASGQADLATESTASGPVDGVVALADDDGRSSSLSLVAVTGPCRAVVHASTSVVRRILVDRVDGSLLLHAVDRASRVDLGIWRLAAGAVDPVRIVGPLPPSLGLGRVWATDLRLDPAGRLLAVQSCLDIQCLTRVADLAGPASAPRIVRGGNQGSLLGFGAGQLVTWAVCDGFPCGVLAWPLDGGPARVLVAEASAAAVTADGRLLVAAVDGDHGPQTVVVDLASGRTKVLHGLGASERPFTGGGAALAGLEVAVDEIAVGPPNGAARAVRPTASGEVLP